MRRFTQKMLCIAIGILFSASLSFAQESDKPVAQKSDKQVFDEKLPEAESDIMKMDEVELRAFVGVLTDCRYLTQMAGQHFRMVCHSARQKYRIEYHRDRAVDYVLAMLEVAAEKNLTVATSTMTAAGADRREEAGRAIKLEEIRKVVEAAQANMPPSATAIIVNAETRLQKTASQSFRAKRPQ